MKLKIFAIKDTASQAFMNPMFLLATGQAVRAFTDQVNEPNRESTIYMHPDDFELYEIGEYETDNGKIKTPDNPEMITRGKDVVIRQDKKEKEISTIQRKAQ